MKNKYQVVPQTATKKPPKAEVSDAEFRRRLALLQKSLSYVRVAD
jgi:hypothetical protein